MMSDDRYLVCDQHLCRQCGTERTWSSRHSWIFREELHRTTEVGSNKGHKKQNLRVKGMRLNLKSKTIFFKNHCGNLQIKHGL